MLLPLRIKSFLAAAAMIIQVQTPAQQSQHCGTGAPPEQWELEFQELLRKQAESMATGKSQGLSRVIPVIFHIIHTGETMGTYPNIDSNQHKSQVDILNRDFAGIGTNVGNIPSAFAGYVANTGIQFCRAAIDYTGSGMIEHGANRINAYHFNWASPADPAVDLQTLFTNSIIPATIWDPNKYINIWVSDRPPNSKLVSFGTYPPSSGLVGVFGNVGTNNFDGFWIYARALGNTGAVTAPHNQGRTATHQMGHFFGLRHIWGDGNCLSDYVRDTPPQKGPTTGCPTGTTTADLCGASQSPSGNMYFNFMDETNDACRYMFTHDQAMRMLTALNQSPQRQNLGTHGFCSSSFTAPSAPAVASFSVNGVVCPQRPHLMMNTSTGYPIPNYQWNVSPSGVFLPNNTASHPMLVVNNPGTYVVSLSAGNSFSTSTYTMQVTTSNFTCEPEPLCLDSLRIIKKTDSLKLYRAPVNQQVSTCTGSATTGWLTGTNCYLDKEIAQYFPPSTFTSIAYPQVNSLIILFDSASTKGGGNLTFRIYGGTPTSGPNALMSPLATVPINSIDKSPDTTIVSYIGKPGVPVTGRRIIPYRVDFPKPITITSPNAGFFAGVEFPSSGSDTIAILSDTRHNVANDSSAWFKNFFGTWRTFRQNRGANVHLAIIPQISCSAITGITEHSQLMSDHIKVMPNPGTGEFTLMLSFPAAQDDIAVRILNMVGQEILTTQLGTVSTEITTINLNNEPPGVYFAEVSNGKQKVVKKLVISR